MSGRTTEEAANAATHAIGVLGSLAGAGILISLAALRGTVLDVVGVTVFSVCLILLYTSSTLYHAARDAMIKRRLRVLDHCAIYALIAGTYTPFMIGPVRGGWGWSLFGVIWGLALGGIAFKLFWVDRFPRISTAVYIFMGWLVVLAAGPLVRSLDPAVLAWLVAGGVTYTVGTVFYHSERIPFAHAIWHIFVLGGSVCHAVAVGMQF
jgi:hemolysin III